MSNVTDVTGQGSTPPAVRLLIVSNDRKQRGKCFHGWPGACRLRRDGQRPCSRDLSFVTPTMVTAAAIVVSFAKVVL